MATPFRIKRSAVPGKAPAVSDLQLGELALNTYDAELYTLRSRPGIGTDIVKIGGAAIENVLYVNKNGNDGNSGATPSDAKLTIKSAVGVSSTGTAIKVAAGTYVEDNPIKCPEQISIVGDSLREVTISPSNVDKDLFHVSPGDMLSELTFSGTVDSGVAVVAFDPENVKYVNQSPYVRFCTNKVANSIGLKVDGSKAVGPFRSMVTDSYTQYNTNGIGVSISNEGYAQIVSLFTMNLDEGVSCHSGGQCDVTNSNSSFGNYGLVADGKGPLQYTGTLATAATENSDRFEINLTAPNNTINNAVYDNVTGLTTITTSTAHGFSVGMGITLSRLVYSCDAYGNYSHTYDSSVNDCITDNTSATHKPDTASYNQLTGVLTITKSGHGYSAQTTKNTGGASYNPSTGILTVTSNGHNIANGSYVKFDLKSFTFTCDKDSGATQHEYPRESDPSYNKWLEVSNSQTNTFDVTVGTSENTSTHQWVSSTGNNIKVASNWIEIADNGIKFKCDKDNYATVHPYPRSTDPASGVKLGIESVSGSDYTVNVGISTYHTFPDKNGNIFNVNSVPTANTFTVYVGPNRFSHTYVGGGKALINLIRPFDGKVVYFDNLYNTIGKVTITNAGSGYNTSPTITIGDPSASWGVPATAVATLLGTKVDEVELISNGRGYTSLPSITFSAPDVGINTATATIELLPSYYSVKESTPVSSGICTITVNENIPYAVGVGSTVPFYRQSRILASSHSFQYIGSGVDPVNSLPSRGGVTIQENEVDNRNGGLVIYTSTDQGGNFRIGEGVVIDQISGTISGNFYSKSLFANVTPLILALGGDK